MCASDILPFYARYVYNFVSAEKWYFSVYTHTTGVNKLNYRGSVSGRKVSVCSQHSTIWLFRTSVRRQMQEVYHNATKIIHKKIVICIHTKHLKKRITVRRCKKLLNVATTRATLWVQYTQTL